MKSAQPYEGLFAHSISMGRIAYWLPLWRNFITHQSWGQRTCVRTRPTLIVRGEQTLECERGGASVGQNLAGQTPIARTGSRRTASAT